ncbi:MAG: RtcB family protein [Sulfurifustis sp.]
MPIIKTINKGRVPVHIWTEDIEPEAIQQLVNISMLPIVHGHVAAMPDVHAGIGATVGSVIPTVKAVIPAAVGVDIGCGMAAVKTSLKASDLPDSLRTIRGAIEDAVPVGFGMHELNQAPEAHAKRLQERLRLLVEKYPEIANAQKPYVWVRQLGTLGGGNHFIELCVDEGDGVWVFLHSGSRGIGNIIGRHFIQVAKEDMLKKDVHLPHRDLAYLEEGSAHFDGYVEAVEWAQDYAMENRQAMLQLVLDAIRPHLPAFDVVGERISVHHNYIDREVIDGVGVFVTRKGAIRAGAGDWCLIPGSMGARSYIAVGKGNAQSFYSCSHGAGRRMSRTKAKQMFTEADLMEQTKGVECRKDRGVIDEAPGAYKDIDQVMELQTDLVEVRHTLKQVLCVKG